MAPTILLTETHPTNTFSPNIDLYEFPLLETTPTTQEELATPYNAATVAWTKL